MEILGTIKALYKEYRQRKVAKKKAKVAINYCKRFNAPELTLEEKQEINNFWAEYGIRINDYSWHRMYYHATGKHDPSFIPDSVAGIIVYQYYNDKRYEATWRDKNMFSRLLPDVPMPNTVCKYIRDRFYFDGKYAGLDALEASANHIFSYVQTHNCELIFKTSRETGFGKGVKKYSFDSVEKVKTVLKDWMLTHDFIVQECVIQHKTFAEFNKSSCNMMRVYSWRHGNEVDILFATVRAGIEGSITDVSFVNGEEQVCLVGISPDGVFADKMIDQNGRVIRSLPAGVHVPSWDKIQGIIKANHLLVDNFDIIGWDFTVDSNENPICFEWNIQWPGTVLYQYVNGPLWRDKTKDVLSFLKDKKNQRKYIPSFMRA